MDTRRSRAIVIVGSARPESDTLEAVRRLAPVVPYDLVELHRHDIRHYDYDEEAVAGDEFAGIAEKLLGYDVIVFATPVYWYAMSGRMKVFFDRLNELTSRAKAVGKALKGKTTYLIACGAAPVLPDGFDVPFRETSAYFGMRFAGTFYRQVA